MIPIRTAHLESAAQSDPGRSGKNNEDRYSLAGFRLDRRAGGKPALVAILADGMGGHQAGEVASEMAVKILGQVIAASNGRDPGQILTSAIQQANSAIHEHGREQNELAGMGTTAVIAWVLDSRLFSASVGNSRLYLLRGGLFRRLTVDHTWIQEALDLGLLTAQQAHDHPNKHVITRHLGMPEVAADIGVRGDAQGDPLQLQAGDVLFMSSDGLNDLVEEAEMQAALESEPLPKALDRLTRLANQRGGHDNITTVALRYHGDDRQFPLPERRMRKLGWFTGLSIVILAAIVLTAWLIFVK